LSPLEVLVLVGVLVSIAVFFVKIWGESEYERGLKRGYYGTLTRDPKAVSEIEGCRCLAPAPLMDYLPTSRLRRLLEVKGGMVFISEKCVSWFVGDGRVVSRLIGDGGIDAAILAVCNHELPDENLDATPFWYTERKPDEDRSR